jgi:hypothetical protein
MADIQSSLTRRRLNCFNVSLRALKDTAKVRSPLTRRRWRSIQTDQEINLINRNLSGKGGSLWKIVMYKRTQRDCA